MCEDRLVSLKCVVRTVNEIPWYRISNGTMKAGAHDETDGWYKAEEVLDALEDIPEAERVKPTECMSLEPENVVHHRAICNELNSLYERKNRDYGDSFHKTWLEEGAAAARLRIGDKFNRYKELSRGKERLVVDETIEDTLIDMANYSIMALMEHRREAEENGCG